MSILGVMVAALALGPAWLRHEPHADEKLFIISPHWDGIKAEFGSAFEAHYFKTTGKRIHVVWMDIGGSGEIKRWLDQRVSQVAQSANPESGVGVDILFGGGMDTLPGMASKNYFEAWTPPKELLAAIPATVNNQELRDAKFRYHATCLSMFGFVYNTEVVEAAKLPVPAIWNDLGAPELHGWITCGDPGSAGSLHLTYELVLQAEGWEMGYATLTRMASNARAFNEGGASVPRDVSLGQSAAGPCIDFYATAPIRRQGATHLKLVVPKDVATATPDCIAIIRNPPNPTAAHAFMEFVLSEAGEKLWYQPRGTPGGPVNYDLERLPVMPSIYKAGLPTNTVANPFTDKPSFMYDGKKAGGRWRLLNDLWKSTWIDAHEELWQARDAVIRAGRDADLGAALARPPFNEEVIAKLAKKSLTPDENNAQRNRWTAWSREWYNKIRVAADSGAAVPEFAGPE